MTIRTDKFLRIAIIGAGFSGTALAAALHRQTTVPCEITLFDKTGRFGAGDAYSTPYPFHLLNVRACDMSAFEDDPSHYVNWLASQRELIPLLDQQIQLPNQFTPRLFYGLYLKTLLDDIQHDKHKQVRLRLASTEVLDVKMNKQGATLLLKDGRDIQADKVVFALGNHAVPAFPFPVSSEMRCLLRPWDYLAPSRIPSQDAALIVGTGLTMIDTVLTLHHQQHQGKIYAVSRHGLLPLPHADSKVATIAVPDDATGRIARITRYLRHISQHQIQAGGDWRSVINAIRSSAPALWATMPIVDKKRFMRHLLPYWNIHRHRVHNQVDSLLQQLIKQGQLTIMSGHVISVDNEEVLIRLRGSSVLTRLPIRWLINCMGAPSDIRSVRLPLLQAMLERGDLRPDDLRLGLDASEHGALIGSDNQPSRSLYTIGPARRGVLGESSAVPEIRKQSFELAKQLLS